MIPGSANPLLLATAAGEYAISRSLRFNSADSASLSLVSYAGSGTFSCWVKRCKLGAAQTIISGVAFNASDQLNGSTAVFRDPSAWMHIVVSSSGTYVNGASVGSGTSITPSAIGSGCDLYLADVHFVDGQNLDASSFGAADTNGIWQPKAYTGTYGTNGFHLDFADNSSAAALGYDAAGSNDWTVNNLSVTAGADNDSLVDSPTNYGTDTGNYCTWNPLYIGAAGLSNGNLDASLSSSGAYNAFGTISVTTGKWYWEVTLTSGASTSYLGIMDSTISSATDNSWSSESRAYRDSGEKYDGSLASYGASYTTGDTIGVALDLDVGTLVFYKNGVSQGTAFSSGLISKEWKPFVYASTLVAYTTNFGQRPFAYSAPSGYTAICTQNLPSTLITTSGSYTGNGVADGPFVYLNGVPTAMTVDGNAVTFGTDADKLSNGFKIRTTSTTFNQNASTYNYSITSTGDPFKTARAQAN